RAERRRLIRYRLFDTNRHDETYERIAVVIRHLGNRSKDGPLFARLDGETSGIVRRPKGGSRVRRRDRGASAPAHRAICSARDDRGRSLSGRAPPVRKRHFAAGGSSRYAWNQIYRYALSRLAFWRANVA